MPKPRKPSTTRKPPVPSDSHADVEDWIRRVMPDLHPIVRRLDELICETILLLPSLSLERRDLSVHAGPA
jgi:hypothetical protein